MSMPRVLLRPLLLAVLLGGLLGLALPYQVGIHVERSLHDRVQAIPGAQLLRRDKGLFRSRYRLILPIAGSAAPLVLNIAVRHGPYWQSGADGGPAWAVLDLKPEAASPVQLRYWSKRPLDLRIRLGLLGKWYLSLAAEKQAGSGSMHLRYDPLAHALRGAVDIDGLRVRAPSQRLLLGRTHVDVDVVGRHLNDWQGEVGIDVHRIGVLRGDYRWLADGLQLRLRQGSGSRDRYRDVDGSMGLASLRRLAPMAQGATLQEVTGGRPVGPFSLIFASVDARADLLPVLWRLIDTASSGPGGDAGADAGPANGLDRFLRHARGGSLADMIRALAAAQTQVASLGLVWPTGSLHLEGRLIGPKRAADGQWRGRLNLSLRGAPVPADWRPTLEPLLSALRPEGARRIGECVLDRGQWRVNGRPVDVRSWFAAP